MTQETVPQNRVRSIGSFDRSGRMQTVATLERKGTETLQQMLRSSYEPSLSGCGCPSVNYKCT